MPPGFAQTAQVMPQTPQFKGVLTKQKPSTAFGLSPPVPHHAMPLSRLGCGGPAQLSEVPNDDGNVVRDIEIGPIVPMKDTPHPAPPDDMPCPLPPAQEAGDADQFHPGAPMMQTGHESRHVLPANDMLPPAVAGEDNSKHDEQTLGTATSTNRVLPSVRTQTHAARSMPCAALPAPSTGMGVANPRALPRPQRYGNRCFVLSGARTQATPP